MVVTVTLNPLLENKLLFKEILSENSRAYSKKLLAGGKGINISRQLNMLGIDNHALTFLGGANGKKLRAILENENINFTAVNTKSETREASLIFNESEQKLKTYFPPNPNISVDEIQKFLVKLEKAIINSSIVVFAGSLPNDETSIIVANGIELCNKLDKICILDTYGKYLSDFMNLCPTVIHNNFSEIESSLRVNLNNTDNVTQFLNKLYESQIKLAFLTSGMKDSYAAKADFHYRIKNPQVLQKNSAGSGDAFVAGIIYGLEKSLIFNDFVKLASALGAVNASVWQTCRVKLEDAKKLVDNVKIEEIGKKIKLIDDSPTI